MRAQFCLRNRGYPAPRRVPRPSAAGPWPRPRSVLRRRVRSHQGRRGHGHEGPTAWESGSPPALIATPFACVPGYVPTLLLRMTHQGHSPTTFTCGFTQLSGNDSSKLRRSSRQSCNAGPRGNTSIFRQSMHISLTILTMVRTRTNGNDRLPPLHASPASASSRAPIPLVRSARTAHTTEVEVAVPRDRRRHFVSCPCWPLDTVFYAKVALCKEPRWGCWPITCTVLP
jgi:hypothetical protein